MRAELGTVKVVQSQEDEGPDQSSGYRNEENGMELMKFAS